jgi:hypothetical protein
MINFLIETKEILKNHNKSSKDVLWVGNAESCISWQDFVKIANFEYDDGFGWAEIALDLLVVGDNWYLERHEYDGSECWKYKEVPKKPVKNKFIITKFCGNSGWVDLEEINLDDN